MSDLSKVRFVSLTTFKHDGTGVATPVWIARSGDAYVLTTDADSWKVRRLGNDARVTVQACDTRGRVSAGSKVHVGTGEVKSDEASNASTERALALKYGWQLKLGRFLTRARSKIRRKKEAERVSVVLTLEPAAPET